MSLEHIDQATEVFRNPGHPYTLGLMKSLPRVDETSHERLYSIPGRPPDLDARPPGCPFAPRCTFAKDICHNEMPPKVEIGPNHVAACFATDEVRG